MWPTTIAAEAWLGLMKAAQRENVICWVDVLECQEGGVVSFHTPKWLFVRASPGGTIQQLWEDKDGQVVLKDKRGSYLEDYLGCIRAALDGGPLRRHMIDTSAVASRMRAGEQVSVQRCYLRPYALGIFICFGGSNQDGAALRDAADKALASIFPEEAKDYPVAASPQMVKLLSALALKSRERRGVRLVGPSGAGKTLLAAHLHRIGRHSGFVKGDFVDVDVVPDRSSIDELYEDITGIAADHTAASAARPGKLDQCRGGTLVLNNLHFAVDSGHFCTKFLQLFEDRPVYTKRGVAAERATADTRFVLTMRDIREPTSQQEFWARVRRFVTLSVPALRDRREDIVPLVLDRLAFNGWCTSSLPAEVTTSLEEASWDDNGNSVVAVIDEACSDATSADDLWAHILARLEPVPKESMTQEVDGFGVHLDLTHVSKGDELAEKVRQVISSDDWVQASNRYCDAAHQLTGISVQIHKQVGTELSKVTERVHSQGSLCKALLRNPRVYWRYCSPNDRAEFENSFLWGTPDRVIPYVCRQAGLRCFWIPMWLPDHETPIGAFSFGQYLQSGEQLNRERLEQLVQESSTALNPLELSSGLIEDAERNLARLTAAQEKSRIYLCWYLVDHYRVHLMDTAMRERDLPLHAERLLKSIEVLAPYLAAWLKEQDGPQR